MDLAKVVVYSILYKQFDRQVFADVIKCDCVRKHNRTNPSELIDERTKIEDKQLREGHKNYFPGHGGSENENK